MKTEGFFGESRRIYKTNGLHKHLERIWCMSFQETINFVELWGNVFSQLKRFKNTAEGLDVRNSYLTSCQLSSFYKYSHS